HRGAVRAAQSRGGDGDPGDPRSAPGPAHAPAGRDHRRAHRSRQQELAVPLYELLMTALDTIRANKIRAFLTTLGVIIGVLSVILLVSLGEGARESLAETFAGMGSNLLQVAPGRRETKGFGSPPVGTVHKLTREDEIALSHRAVSLDGVSGIIN